MPEPPTTDDDVWRTCAECEAARLAASGRIFGADDIRERCGTPTRPNLVGSLFGTIHGRHEIQLVDYARAAAGPRKGGVNGRWRGAQHAPIDPAPPRRTRAETRDAITTAIRDNPGLSDRTIAALVGASPTTVGTVRRSLAVQVGQDR